MSRVARKARRVEQTDLDRTFNTELGVLKRERDEKLQVAGKQYAEGMKVLRAAQAEARAEAYATYEEGRGKLLTRLAKQVAA